MLLFTIVDDAGRARAASRMLASLLYPYDDDARERSQRGCSSSSATNISVAMKWMGRSISRSLKWLEHQKIDRPSESRLPAYREIRRSSREESRALDADLVPSTLDPVSSTSAAADAPRARAVEKKSRKGNATPLPEGLLAPRRGPHLRFIVRTIGARNRAGSREVQEPRDAERPTLRQLDCRGAQLAAWLC